MPRQQSGFGFLVFFFIGGFLLLFGWVILQQSAGALEFVTYTSSKQTYDIAQAIDYESLWNQVAVYDLPAQPVHPLLESRAGVIDTSSDITVHLGAHAESHGAEAELARQCFGQHGTLALFKFTHDDRYARLCQYDDGWIVVQFLKRIAEREYIEVSAYVPHLTDVSFAGIRDWLLKCGFSAFKGPLP